MLVLVVVVGVVHDDLVSMRMMQMVPMEMAVVLLHIFILFLFVEGVLVLVESLEFVVLPLLLVFVLNLLSIHIVIGHPFLPHIVAVVGVVGVVPVVGILLVLVFKSVWINILILVDGEQPVPSVVALIAVVLRFEYQWLHVMHHLLAPLLVMGRMM